jgi:6-phosphofructo-2-kinase
MLGAAVLLHCMLRCCLMLTAILGTFSASADTHSMHRLTLCCHTTAGFPTKVFNIGDYRRKLGFAGVDKSFFDADNAEGMRIREKMVEVVQDEMYTWLQQDEEAKVCMYVVYLS